LILETIGIGKGSPIYLPGAKIFPNPSTFFTGYIVLFWGYSYLKG